MDQLINQLRQDFSEFEFVESDNFRWRASKKTINFIPNAAGKPANWMLIHELAHGTLGHEYFTSDFGLLRQEVEAWAKAKKLAAEYNIKIDDEYIEDCLDTYRDWLHARSSCPRCSSASLQLDNEPVYLCHNCDYSWRVSEARFCRPYRLTRKKDKISI